MATKAAIRNKTLKKLRVIAEDETPSASAITDVEEGYDEMHPWLLSKNAANWDSDEDIPDEAVHSVVTILASRMADDFVVDELRYQRLQVEADFALTRLIEISASPYVPNETEAQYF